MIDDDFSSGGGYPGAYFVRNPANAFDESYVDLAFTASGGNPGDALVLTHIHDVVRDLATGLPFGGQGETELTSHLNGDFEYDPFAEG